MSEAPKPKNRLSHGTPPRDCPMGHQRMMRWDAWDKWDTGRRRYPERCSGAQANRDHEAPVGVGKIWRSTPHGAAVRGVQRVALWR